MTAEALGAVLSVLRRDEAFLIDLAQQLVRIPTVNPRLQAGPGLNHEADLQYYLRAVLDGFGMHTETQEVAAGRPNLIGVLSGRPNRSLALAGHVDVAPVGDAAQWSVAPFAGEVVEGRLYGRGALAMKSGLAAAVAVARAIRLAQAPLVGQLELHAVVDGEAGGLGARDLVRRGWRAAGMVMPDNTNEAVLTAHGGRDWVRVSLRGRAPNLAARPEPLAGVSALDMAVRLVTEANGLAARSAAHRPGAVRAGAMLCGAGQGANGLPLVLTDPGQTPDAAAVDFEVTFAPDQALADIRAAFEAFVRDFAEQDAWLREHPPVVRWDLHGRAQPPLLTPVDHPLAQAARRAAGAAGPWDRMAEMGDAGHYSSAGIPSVAYGPAGGGRGGPDEHVLVASMLAVAEALAAVVIEWCGVA